MTRLSADLGNTFKMTLAILGPVFVIGLMAALVYYFMTRHHRKSIMASRIKNDPDVYLVNDELLRATSAGDSTLRVS